MLWRAIGRYFGLDRQRDVTATDSARSLTPDPRLRPRRRSEVVFLVRRAAGCAAVGGLLVGAYALGVRAGVDRVREQTNGFVRPTPRGPTDPQSVADLLASYGLNCDVPVVDHAPSAWMRRSYVCPVDEQRFELDFHHQGWQVFRSLDLLAIGMGCVPVGGTIHRQWWAVHRDDWMVVLHDPLVAEHLGQIPGVVVSEGRCVTRSAGRVA